MWRKLLVVSLVLMFAFGILFLSIFRTAAVRYEFGGTNVPQPTQSGDGEIFIDYYLAYPGNVLPGSPFWPLKAVRDRAWIFLTTNSTRRAELMLLFADKRLGSAKILFEEGNPEESLSTLTKAEKYLDDASRQEKESREKGFDTTEFLSTLTKASLKHYAQILEIEETAPEEAKPVINESLDY